MSGIAGYKTIFNLKGKKAIVTGGSRGIGKAIALRLAEQGAAVVIAARKIEGCERVAAAIRERGGRALAQAFHAGDREAPAKLVAAAVAHFGKVDLLVNNIGNYNPQDVTRLDPDVWDETIGANLSGAYYCCHHALAVMPDGGNIINIGMAGLEGIRANTRGADYYVSKTGLLVLTRALAAAYAPRQIRVNMVSPGQLENSVDLPPADEISRWVPMGRSGTLDDIAQAVHYLLDASYVTGQNIDVAGGYRL